jgi:hypothetical protein
MKKEKILKKLFSIVQQDIVLNVIWYGNKKGSDVDLFVLLDNDCGYHPVRTQGLDIIFVGKDSLDTMLSHLDPIVVEPLYGGETIYGPHDFIKICAGKLSYNDDVVPYLLQWAKTCYEWAEDCMLMRKKASALNNLIFCYSHIKIAERYLETHKLVLFKDTLDMWLIRNREIFKNPDTEISEIYLVCLMNRLKKMLTKEHRMIRSR